MKQQHRLILSEYPFSEKQKKQLGHLVHYHHYQVITVRLIADFEILWQRRKKRDLAVERHLSHIMTHYHKGDRIEDRSQADHHITKEDFFKKIEQQGYDQFQLGNLYEVNVTDFKKIDYTELFDYLRKQLTK